MDLFSLSGRTAVITGASGAIGGAIASGFARAGADLALTYNNNAGPAEGVAAAAAALGVRTRSDRVDALDADAIAAHADAVRARA